MADAQSYILGELLCALLPLFVDGVLRNRNKEMLSKWSHQNILANVLVLTRPKRLLFSKKRKRVKICQNAFALNQSDTPLCNKICMRNSFETLESPVDRDKAETQTRRSIRVYVELQRNVRSTENAPYPKCHSWKSTLGLLYLLNCV